LQCCTLLGAHAQTSPERSVHCHVMCHRRRRAPLACGEVASAVPQGHAHAGSFVWRRCDRYQHRRRAQFALLVQCIRLHVRRRCTQLEVSVAANCGNIHNQGSRVSGIRQRQQRITLATQAVGRPVAHGSASCDAHNWGQPVCAGTDQENCPSSAHKAY
jgi:hypothetical protein